MGDNKLQPATYLKQSAILSAVALALLVITAVSAMLATPHSGQEQFETISSLTDYVASLQSVNASLRTTLFLDSLFALSYTAAICFAVIGFASRNLPVAWFCGLGILAVMGLDYWENITMAHSLDIIANDLGFTAERMVHQAQISALKWHSSATVLFAISFLIPDKRFVEILLVWGTRLGLAIAVPLFVIDGFGLREAGGLMILGSMASGFVLLAIVAWQNAME